MAAGPWVFYATAKKYLCTADIDLDTDTFQMGLYTSASNALSSLNLSVIGSVNNEVTEQFGYLSSGKTMAVTWAVGASATEMRFDATAVIWTASGGDIANVKYAVIWTVDGVAGNRKLLCYSQLSTSQFTVTSGNTLTVTPSGNGIFELN